MIITNKSQLPDSIFKFLEQAHSFYDHDAVAGTLSATTLLKPIQEIVLLKRYGDQIEVDGMDQMWSVLGSGVHAVLEKTEGYQPCGRLYAEIDGVKISGKPDYIVNKCVDDYKITSVFSIIFKSKERDWRRQLSIYRYLYFKQNGVLLDEIGHIVAILRDWNKNGKGDDYPKFPMVEITLKLSSIEATEQFLRSKITDLKIFEKELDSVLPECTDEERWYNEKSGKYLKCEKYCQAASKCVQWKKEQDKMLFPPQKQEIA